MAKARQARGRAKRLFIDPVTRERVPEGTAGAVEMPDFVMRKRPAPGEPLEDVLIDREEIGDRRCTWGVDLTDEEVTARARWTAAERKRDDAAQAELDKLKGKQELPGVTATFRTAGAAAEEYFAANSDFFDQFHGVDVRDTLIEWAGKQRVRVKRKARAKGGKGDYFAPLTETTKGKRIIGAASGGAGDDGLIVRLLTWIFSQTKSKRWGAVEWGMVESLEGALREAHDREVGTVGWEPLVYDHATWRPALSGSYSDEELLGHPEVEASPRARNVVRRRVNVGILEDARGRLERAYRERKACLSRDVQAVVRRRIRLLRKLEARPLALDHDEICDPEAVETLDGERQACSLRTVLADVERLEAACEAGYDPGWAQAAVTGEREAPLEPLYEAPEAWGAPEAWERPDAWELQAQPTQAPLVEPEPPPMDEDDFEAVDAGEIPF